MTTTANLAQLAHALAAAPDVPALAAIILGPMQAVIPADEVVVDVTALELNRPAMIRHGVDPSWSKRYDKEFFAVNPATAALKAGLAARGPFVRRFEAMVSGDLRETRFFKEYMAPQKHAHSLVAGMSLTPSGGPPAMVALFVRTENSPNFSDAEVSALTLLTPALAWAANAIIRTSDDWTKAIVQHAFGLPPKLAAVAVLLARGMSNQEVATELGITVGTAKQYVHELLDWTGAASRSDLCRLVLS